MADGSTDPMRARWRYALEIEYDGGPFFGWQHQDTVPTIAGAIAAALRGLTGCNVRPVGAGRTDSGVHAAAQVAHCDLLREIAPGRLRDGLNAHLRPAPIAIVRAARVDAEFHARFGARKRTYVYRILNRRAPPTRARGRVFHIPRSLDVAGMSEASQVLIGTHDFSTFRAAHCQAKSPVKTLDRVSISQNEGDIRLRFEARSFLYRQVRSMVGSLVDVGLGRASREDLTEALAAKKRAACGPVAPAEGLCLWNVSYPEPPDWE